MKAAVWYGVKDIRVLDVPEPPTPKPGEIKIEVQWCGICGSDLHEYLAGPIFIPVYEPHPLTGVKAPVILGHEFSGKVVEVGEGVKNIKVGDRVAPDGCQVCWECYWCKRMQYNLCEKLAFTGLAAPGAFAEYVNVPAYCAYKLTDYMTYEQGALVEPFAIGLHAVLKAPVLEGDTIVVVGAGTIGLVVLQCARAAGATQLIAVEIVETRGKLAQELGATTVIDPTKLNPADEVFRLTDGIGADISFECAGVESTVPLAIATTRKGGKTVAVGVHERPGKVNYNDIVFNEKELIGSVDNNGQFAPVIRLLADGRLRAEPMITARIKLEDIVKKGFEELTNKKRDIKIIVTPR